MEKNIDSREILVAFANYGFRKASMEDLARVADVSRQTLYKRFKTKQALLDWAVTGFVEARYGRASARLNRTDQSANDGLLGFYMEWMGELVPMLHNTSHGSEIMDMSTESLEHAGINTHADYEGMVTAFLIEKGLCRNLETAAETYFLLTMSSKGLLFKEKTEANFEAGMERIIQAVFPRLGQS